MSAKQPIKTLKLASGDMPAIGLGTWQSEKGQVREAVKVALQSGYRHIDAAWIYGNENEVGEGMKDSGVPRKDVWLTSKLWNAFHRPQDVEGALDQSLKRLGTDYLDLYLMHFPVAFGVPEDGRIRALPKGPDKKVLVDHKLTEDVVSTWKALEKLVKKGKVRNIGVCNFNERRLKTLLAAAEVPVSVLQVELSLSCHQPELVQFAKDNKIAVQAYSPLGSTGAGLRENKVVRKIAEAHKCDPAQVLVSWPLHEGICVLPKSVTPQRIKDNFKVVALTFDDLSELNIEATRTPMRRAVADTWGVDVFEDDKTQSKL